MNEFEILGLAQKTLAPYVLKSIENSGCNMTEARMAVRFLFEELDQRLDESGMLSQFKFYQEKT